MSLLSLLREKRRHVAEEWIKSIFATYPLDTVGFLRKGKDPFENPVGDKTRQAVDALLEALLVNDGLEFESVNQPLDDLMRIRSLQDFAPSGAVGVVFFLKSIIRKVVQSEISDAKSAQELLQFESKIDSLALISFDIYCKCKEQVYEIRIKEVSNRHSRLLERAKMLYEPSAEASDTNQP